MNRVLLLFAICSPLVCATPRVWADNSKDGSIAVEIKGAMLANVFVAAPDGGLRTLTSASILAGGEELFLDFSRSLLAEQELIDESEPRHGDGRVKKVDVKGRLEFRRIQRPVKWKSIGRGLGEDTAPVPFVIVESLRIYLARP